jgi:cytoskeletal protein RodZ
MNIDNEELLQRTYALTKENNKLLKKLRHSGWISTIFKLLFWAVMIGMPIWMYYTMFQPVLQQGMSALEQVQGVTSGIDMNKIQGLINSLPKIDSIPVGQITN